jgi:hypothetical protein
MGNNVPSGSKFEFKTKFELQILEAELLLNLNQIYSRSKPIWKNLINSLNFLFALAFQNVNFDCHGCMAKSKVSIQAPLGLGLKEKWKEGLNLNLTKQSSLTLDTQQLQDKAL